MKCRAIRGAVCVNANQLDDILEATRALLEQLLLANDLRKEQIISAVFTATSDLDAVYPARAARELGWSQVPLLCMQEMAVAKSLPRCIRVLIHCNTHRSPDEIRHIYLGKARRLRPDLLTQDRPSEQSEEK